jgi:hypothetical protein
MQHFRSEMAKMPCHITDGPSDPEDAQDRDFAEYQEDFHSERQARTDERSGILLQIQITQQKLTKHNAFDKRDLEALLKRIGRYLRSEDPV